MAPIALLTNTRSSSWGLGLGGVIKHGTVQHFETEPVIRHIRDILIKLTWERHILIKQQNHNHRDKLRKVQNRSCPDPDHFQLRGMSHIK